MLGACLLSLGSLAALGTVLILAEAAFSNCHSARAGRFPLHPKVLGAALDFAKLEGRAREGGGGVGAVELRERAAT